MPAPAARRNTDPGALDRLLAFHAQELARYLPPPAGLDPARTDPAAARHLAVQAATYAMAAFDPQDAIDAMMVRSIVMTAHMALHPGNTDALSRYMRTTVTMLLKSLESHQVRRRMRDGPPIPGRRRKTPKQIEVPPVVPLPEGMTDWLDLITDPVLRRRLDAR